MSTDTGQRTRFRAALALVGEIDQNLTRDKPRYMTRGAPIPTYRDRSGQLLYTLDMVVRAILADDLMPIEEAANGKAI